MPLLLWQIFVVIFDQSNSSVFKARNGILVTETRNYYFNPHTPVAQKVADEVVSRRFQGEGVEFF